MPSRHRHPETLAEAWSNVRADYAAAKQGRFRRRRTGIVSTGSGADYHIRSEADYLRVMEYARDMDRNDSLIGQAVDRAKNNTVQNGFEFDPQTGVPAVDAALKTEFHAWAQDPDRADAAGEMTFTDQQELALRHAFVDGECFALPLEDGSIQMIESHRCRTPNNAKLDRAGGQALVHGILLDEQRRRLQYWFTKDEIDPNYQVARVADMEKYDARDPGSGERTVWHICDKKRISQTRAVTALAPVFDLAGMFEDVNFAKVVQQQIVSCIAFFRMLDKDAKTPRSTGGGGQTGAQETETLTDGSSRIIQGIAPGLELIGRPGEKLEGFSPNIPNAEYFSHVKLIVTLIGINLGLPLVMMLMDASDTNFSGWRGAIDQAKRGFERNQRWLTGAFHRNVARWKVLQFIEEFPALRALIQKHNKSAGLLETPTGGGKATGAIFAHRWNTPRWPYVQPLQDNQADALQVEKRLSSLRRITSRRGDDIDELRTERIADNKSEILAAIAAAREIKEETGGEEGGVEVDWHELIYLPAGDAVQAALKQEQIAEKATESEGGLTDAA